MLIYSGANRLDTKIFVGVTVSGVNRQLILPTFYTLDGKESLSGRKIEDYGKIEIVDKTSKNKNDESLSDPE